MASQIPLTRGYVAIVDDADFDRLNQSKWHVSIGPEGRVCAVVRNRPTVDGVRGRIFMHRALIQPPATLLVDHIDGNPLNNQRRNLRLATQTQNVRNRRNRAHPERFKGIKRDANTPHLWDARIALGGRRLFLGFFDTAEEAARAYDYAASIHFGEFACLNFPDETPAPVPPRKRVHLTGEARFNTKLSDAEVLEIRARRLGGEELKPIAADYGVSIATVCNIARGKRACFWAAA